MLEVSHTLIQRTKQDLLHEECSHWRAKASSAGRTGFDSWATVLQPVMWRQHSAYVFGGGGAWVSRGSPHGEICHEFGERAWVQIVDYLKCHPLLPTLEKNTFSVCSTLFPALKQKPGLPASLLEVFLVLRQQRVKWQDQARLGPCRPTTSHPPLLHLVFPSGTA